MNVENLRKLRDLLLANAANERGACFDMGGWGYSETTSLGMNCGTTACAMGLAAISGIFEEDGLTFSESDSYAEGAGVSLNFFWDGARITGFNAAMKLFDIDRTISNLLFSGNGQSGAEGERLMAATIDKLIAGDPLWYGAWR